MESVSVGAVIAGLGEAWRLVSERLPEAKLVIVGRRKWWSADMEDAWRAMRHQEDVVFAEVRVVGPDVSPGTYRSTPWGLLLRAVPEKSDAGGLKSSGEAPVCTI